MPWIMLFLMPLLPVGILQPGVAICYLPPVNATVDVSFEAPACTYCPGQRGNEYEVSPGTPVHAAAAGMVTFAGVVVGVRYVVVVHDDGIRSTYGVLHRTAVAVDQRVDAGQVIGWSTSRLYFGLKAADGTPLDPNGLLAVATRRARLVPTTDSPSRPAVERPPSCSASVPRGRSPR